ncbi:MAG: metallophosphoesterase [Desulfobacterales bacterium]|nr:metallophosphoesterase [Desulfobacterales bacterium]
MSSQPLLILHLSDLHFGKNSRFSGHNPRDLGKMFCQAVNDECKNRNFPVSVGLVIVTGDIAEAALPEEYSQANIFFDVLIEYLPLRRERFIFVPGNHDVSWNKCKEIEKKGMDDKKLEERMDAVKFDYFEQFLREFYHDDRKKFAINIEKNAYIYNFNELSISVGALNSCEVESHLKQQGYLSKLQLEGLMKHWYSDLNLLKIIAVHHNPHITTQESIQEWTDKIEKEGSLNTEYLRHFVTDITGLEGKELLKNLVEDCQVPIVLHGHQHSSAYEIWGWKQQTGQTHLISAGSMGLKPGELPKDQINNTQLILLKPENQTMQVCSLVYNPKARGKGILSPGYFVRDNTYPNCYEQVISIPRNGNRDNGATKLDVLKVLYRLKPLEKISSEQIRSELNLSTEQIDDFILDLNEKRLLDAVYVDGKALLGITTDGRIIVKDHVTE